MRRRKLPPKPPLVHVHHVGVNQALERVGLHWQLSGHRAPDKDDQAWFLSRCQEQGWTDLFLHYPNVLSIAYSTTLLNRVLNAEAESVES